jgi:hypothetical protein
MMALLGFLFLEHEQRAPRQVACRDPRNLDVGDADCGNSVRGIPCRCCSSQEWLGRRRRCAFLAARTLHGRSVMIGASLGAVGFFFYCVARWGRWDIYMLTQEAGWAIVPDYLALFKPSSYHWQIPALNDPVTHEPDDDGDRRVAFCSHRDRASCCRLCGRKFAGQSGSDFISAAFVHLLHRVSGVASSRWKACSATTSLRACINRAGNFCNFCINYRPRGPPCAQSEWRRLRCSARPGSASRVVRLEFYEGRLGSLRK